jgi:hypothetical protein
MRRQKSLLFGVPALALLFTYAQNRQAHPKESRPEDHEVQQWRSYTWGILSFRYPPGWHVEPQYYRTPPEEQAGIPASILGLTISPIGEKRVSSRTISISGRQANCDSLTSCECFTIYEAEYTCGPDSETSRIFDQLLKTIRYDNPDSTFHIVAPTAQDQLRSNANYTIRWNTKAGLHIRRVTLTIWNTTSRLGGDGLVLNVKNVPNSGKFDWFVPVSLKSAAPYLIEISYLKPIKAQPPALSGGRIYEGRSEPFYIY